MSDTIKMFDATCGEPDLEQLRRHGWAVNHTTGRYAAAWRGNEQVVFVWGEQGWQRVHTHGTGRQAA